MSDDYDRFKPAIPHLTELLNRLPFVTWDRLIVEDEWVCVYGWIARDDRRSDFVLFRVPLNPEADGATSYTSSARFDGLIADLVDPGGVERTNRPTDPCWRVEAWMPDVKYAASESA